MCSCSLNFGPGRNNERCYFPNPCASLPRVFRSSRRESLALHSPAAVRHPISSELPSLSVSSPKCREGAQGGRGRPLSRQDRLMIWGLGCEQSCPDVAPLFQSPLLAHSVGLNQSSGPVHCPPWKRSAPESEPESPLPSISTQLEYDA